MGISYPDLLGFEGYGIGGEDYAWNELGKDVLRSLVLLIEVLVRVGLSRWLILVEWTLGERAS